MDDEVFEKEAIKYIIKKERMWDKKTQSRNLGKIDPPKSASDIYTHAIYYIPKHAFKVGIFQYKDIMYRVIYNECLERWTLELLLGTDFDGYKDDVEAVHHG